MGPAKRWAGEDARDAPVNVLSGGKNQSPQGTTAGATLWQNTDLRGSWETTGLSYLFPAGTSLSGEAIGSSCGTQIPSVLGGHWPELGKRSCIYIHLTSPAALHLLCSGAYILLLPASARDVKDWVIIPGLRRSPGGENCNPLQYSCLRNPMDRGTWRTTVPGVTKTQIGLSACTHTYTHSLSLSLFLSVFLQPACEFKELM